jgi:uncharacterized protein (DUF58 family)
MKTAGSNFATRAGLAVLLILVLACAYFGLAAPGVFLGGLLLLCALVLFWSRTSLRRIDVRFSGGDICAFPGDRFRVEAVLTNRKFLPLLWLDLAIPTGERPCVGPVGGGDGLSETFTWVMPQQTLRWRQEAAALRRGVCPVDTLTLRSGDGFGLTEQSAETAPSGRFRFVVYPRIVPVDLRPVLRSMRELERAGDGLTVDKTLLNSTRDYRSGDSFRDINWRLLARTDDVQVNVYEKLAVRRVCFLPDLASYCDTETVAHGDGTETVYHVREEALERMLSLIASLSARLAERNVLCSLAVPGFSGHSERTFIPEIAADQVMPVLVSLAEIDYVGGPAAFSAEELLSARHRLGQLYLFSRDAAHAAFRDGDTAEMLGLIRVLAETDSTADGPSVLKESDLLTP